MDLQYIKAMLNNPPEIKTDYFMKSYSTCESYFKRIVFIGLRLKGVQYIQAEKIIRTTHIPIRVSLMRGLYLIDEQKSKDVLKQKAIQDSLNLFHSFSAPHRHLVSHGVIREIIDQRILILLIELNVKMIKEIEHELNRVFRLSVFNEPRDWGAKISNTVFSENDIKKLKLGNDASEPISSKKAEKSYKAINWLHR